ECKSQLKLTGGSTSNLISHLSNVHGITKDGPKLSEHDDHSKQTKIDSFVATTTTYQHNKSKNNKLIMALIKFIICDAQPFNLVSSQFFCEFVKELDPMFILPSEKRIKQTIHTLYNQCAGTWERLLLIKDAINIVLTTLTVSTASEARKDARRLRQIQLTKDEWDLMKDLVVILGPFYETTEELGGSEYVTISYMFPSILALMQKLA
ncbi:29247_t:CDS:2, partial [Gigaspora margarita]